jgi:hypothetical protein
MVESILLTPVEAFKDVARLETVVSRVAAHAMDIAELSGNSSVGPHGRS